MLATREEGVKLQVLGIPKTIADVTAAARAHSGVVIFAIKMCSRLRSSTVLHGVFRRE